MSISSIRLWFLAASAMLAATACSDSPRDMEKPAVVTTGIAASPSDCDSYRAGDTLHFCYRFTDNEELGNYNLEVHSNHDHHTHSTSSVECPEGEEGDAVVGRLWVFNHDYPIPAGQKDYVATADIEVPADAAPGDYHFMVRVTDQAGWQELRSVAISVVR